MSRPAIHKAPPVTMTVVGLCALVYLLMLVFGRERVMPPLLISEYLRPALSAWRAWLPEVQAGQVWRLATPALLHFSLFHIVFNLLWTWELGRLIEQRQGGRLLAGLLLLMAAAANLAQYAVSGPLFGGMSGAVYGLFGYVWLQGALNPAFGARLNPAVVKLLLAWFVICWSGILQLVGIQVANTAHTAGLIAGLLLGLAVRRRRAGGLR